MPKLTAKFIEENAVAPACGQVILRDSELVGFGLRLTKGSMAWIVECRVNGAVKRMTIGKYHLVPIEQARQEARRLLSGLAASKAPRANIPTLGEVLVKYLAVRNLAKNTVRSYTQLTRRCLGDWLELPITSITREMVLARHKVLTRPTKQGTKGEIQANMAMSNLNTLLIFAANNYDEVDGQPILIRNPVKALSQNRAWHKEPCRRVVIPDHRLPDFYRAVMSLRQPMVKDFLMLLILTGLRRNEAATLKWTDVDFDCRTLTVRAENTKNRNEYSIPISDFVFDLLSRRKLDPRQSEYVFPSRKGHIVDPSTAIENVLARCGFKFVPHDLRRTYITMAAKIGIPHHLIRALVNHVSVADVTSGYVVFHVEHLRDPVEQITDRFLALLGANSEESAQTSA